MGRKNLKTLAGFDVPNADGLVEGARNNHVGLGIEVNTENVVGMAIKGLDKGPRGDIPEAKGLIVGGRYKKTRIRGESKVGDTLFMALELLEWGQSGIGASIGAKGLIGGGRAEKAAVRREFDG